jgi:hypothetical protein
MQLVRNGNRLRRAIAMLGDDEVGLAAPGVVAFERIRPVPDPVVPLAHDGAWCVVGLGSHSSPNRARRMVLRQWLRSRRRGSAADLQRESAGRNPRHRQSRPLLRPGCPSCGRRDSSGARRVVADRSRSPRRRGCDRDVGCCPGVERLPHPVYQRPAPAGRGRRGIPATADLTLARGNAVRLGLLAATEILMRRVEASASD